MLNSFLILFVQEDVERGNRRINGAGAGGTIQS